MVSQLSEKYDPCTEKHSEVYFNLPEVQKSLHVLPEAAPAKWETCRYVCYFCILEFCHLPNVTRPPDHLALSLYETYYIFLKGCIKYFDAASIALIK